MTASSVAIMNSGSMRNDGNSGIIVHACMHARVSSHYVHAEDFLWIFEVNLLIYEISEFPYDLNFVVAD